MEDDQESSFADLLARTATPASSMYASAPAHDAEQDPWANPFASGAEVSPYVQQLEQQGVIEEREPVQIYQQQSPAYDQLPEIYPASQPQPPSVIVQREREHDQEQAMLAALQPSTYVSHAPAPEHDAFALPPPQQPVKAQPTSDLLGLDEIPDPSEALKKAFVKSVTPKANPPPIASPQKRNKGKRGIVAGLPSKPKEAPKEVQSDRTAVVEDTSQQGDGKAGNSPESGQTGLPKSSTIENASVEQPQEQEPVISAEPADAPAPASAEAPPSMETNDTATDAAAPASSQTTPTASHHPLPPSRTETPTLSRSETPSRPDRVITSPLDTPSGSQSSFAALSIGASSSGKGWAAIDGDDEDEGGLFGKGFVPPSASSGHSWGVTAGQTGWGNEEATFVAEPSRSVTPPIETPREPTTPTRQPSSPTSATNQLLRAPQTPTRSKALFSISVSDPTKVGDPIRGHIVYTVRTRTTSPHFHKGDFSALRRFSDFLWLFEALTLNNPGVIVPPVPDKHPFGRFQDQFVETRRLALERCLRKMCAHPILQLDPDLKLFLESDSFALDIKQRKLEMVQEKQGYLASWTGPKYFEQDEWFDSRKIFLDSLETQLKGLVKSIDTTSKQRLELALNVADLADAITLLVDSDLGSALSSALARLADLARQEKDAQEEQAKADVVHVMSTADEYLRLIASVRLAFASRIKAYVAWQNAEKDVARLRSARDKARQVGRTAADGESERRAREAASDFEQISRLVKVEFARFEQERVDEFKRMLERYLDGMVYRQHELIKAWEAYHGVILKMVQASQAQRQAAIAAA